MAGTHCSGDLNSKKQLQNIWVWKDMFLKLYDELAPALQHRYQNERFFGNKEKSFDCTLKACYSNLMLISWQHARGWERHGGGRI